MPVKPGVVPHMGDVTAATRVQLAQLGGMGTSRSTRSPSRRPGRRKKSRSSAKSTRSRSGTSRKRSKKRSGGRLKKGSAEAKRYMARLRKMRRR